MAGKPKPRTGPTSWKPGQTGNPGGRSPRVGPNGETLAQLSRIYTPEVLERLMKIIRAPDDEIALKAIAIWAERAWGKPKAAEEDGEGKSDLSTVLTQLIDKLPG